MAPKDIFCKAIIEIDLNSIRHWKNRKHKRLDNTISQAKWEPTENVEDQGLNQEIGIGDRIEIDEEGRGHEIVGEMWTETLGDPGVDLETETEKEIAGVKSILEAQAKATLKVPWPLLPTLNEILNRTKNENKKN